MSEFGQVDVVIGTQRGDEAKARWIVELLETGQYGYVARFNGADNAGHTSDIGGTEINLHQVPMGILFPGVMNLITKASFVNPTSLVDEIGYLRSRDLKVDDDSLAISHAAHLILPGHVLLDQVSESDDAKKQGSTAKGIRYVARDKSERTGVRVEELLNDSDRIEEAVIRGLEEANRALKAAGRQEVDVTEIWSTWYKKARGIGRFITDTSALVREALIEGDRILAEGAQSFGLDIDHGTYPYVTSSNTGVAAVQNSLGIGPKVIGNVYGAVKAIKSSVGAPHSVLPTIMDSELQDEIRGESGKIDTEKGKSTDRERDLCELDVAEVRTSIEANGVDEVFLAKLDWVPKVGPTTRIAESYTDGKRTLEYSPSDSADRLRKVTPNYIELPTWDEPISHTRKFEDLPLNAQVYVRTVEALLDKPITKIGVGPYRGQMIERPIS